MKKILLVLMAIGCLALTPSEKKIVQDAQQHIEAAKAENVEAWGEAQAAWNMAAEADAHAKATGDAANIVKQQIEVAHKNEQALADSIKKMKPVYDACTKWWGLGAFVWGFEELIKHLLILALVGVGIAILLFVLSFFFPAILPFIKMIGTFFGSIFNRVTSFLKSRSYKNIFPLRPPPSPPPPSKT